MGNALNLHEGWIAGVLLAVMLASVTGSVAAANWTEGLGVAIWAGLGGLLFASLVARVRLNGLIGLVCALVVGAAFVAFLVSPQVGPPDATWNEKVVLIEERLDQWLVRVIAGGVGTDAFIFLLFCVALAWVIGYVSAWSVLRHHQPWGAILPAGAVLLLNLFYAPPQSGLYLMIFLLATLLLLVRTCLLRRQQTWAHYAVRFANDIGLDFLIYGVIFSGLIILLAWLIPPTAPGPQWLSFILDRVRDPWQEVQQDVTRAFSTVRTVNNAAPTTFFSNSLAMGGPIRLGNRPVFDVEAEQGRYWRAVVFDKYTGAGWVTTADTTASFLADDPRLKTPPMGLRRAITQTVEILLPTDNLVVAAAQPLRVGEPVNARFTLVRVSADNEYVDLHALRLQRPIQQGLTYTVVSSLSGADEASLRQASSNYPAYIRERYLPIPSSVPPRVRELARKITAGASNNYDKARAIETYLREKIKYNENVAPAPVGRDGVDYMLFDRPEGYCNYYASAMAVMARAVGIPARVASGYAVGRAEDGSFHLNESNAHSWPELYIGEAGWIEFEPTSARPEIVRPVRTDASASNPELNAAQAQDEERRRGRGPDRLEALDHNQNAAANPSPILGWLTGPWGVGLGGSLFLGLIIGGAVAMVQSRWQRRVRGLPPAARALEEMYRFAPLAGFRERPQATPSECANHLTQLMPDARVAIAQVTAWYVRERYGAYALEPTEQQQALATSRRLQPRVWGGVFDHYIGKYIEAAYQSIKKFNRQLDHKLP